MSKNSVLLEFAMFPTDKDTGVSAYVSRIIKVIDESGFDYKLTAMGTIIEFPTMRDALDLIEKSFNTLDNDCERIYSTLTFDIRKGELGRIKKKVEAVESIIGKVSK